MASSYLQELTTIINYQTDKSSLNAAKGSIQSFTTFFQNAANMSLVFSQAIKPVINQFTNLTSSLMKTRLETQGIKNNFTLLLGSQEKSNKLFAELQEYSRNSSFSLSTLGNAAKVLVNFGVASDQAKNRLKQLGDIALGNETALNSFAVNYGQILSKGVADSVDIKQFINQGFNPVAILKGMQKYSKFDFAKGAVTAQMITEALDEATKAGGKYFNGASVNANNWQSAWNTAIGVVKEKLSGAVVPLENLIMKFADRARSLDLTTLTNALSTIYASIEKIGMAFLENQGIIFGIANILAKIVGWGAKIVAFMIGSKLVLGAIVLGLIAIILKLGFWAAGLVRNSALMRNIGIYYELLVAKQMQLNALQGASLGKMGKMGILAKSIGFGLAEGGAGLAKTSVGFMKIISTVGTSLVRFFTGPIGIILTMISGVRLLLNEAKKASAEINGTTNKQPRYEGNHLGVKNSLAYHENDLKELNKARAEQNEAMKNYQNINNPKSAVRIGKSKEDIERLSKIYLDRAEAAGAEIEKKKEKVISSAGRLENLFNTKEHKDEDLAAYYGSIKDKLNTKDASQIKLEEIRQKQLLDAQTYNESKTTIIHQNNRTEINNNITGAWNLQDTFAKLKTEVEKLNKYASKNNLDLLALQTAK